MASGRGNRRLVAIPVAPELVFESMKNTSVTVTEEDGRRFVIERETELPEDARFVRAGLDGNGILNLMVESDSFGEIEEGCQVPSLKMSFKIQRCINRIEELDHDT